MTFYLAVASAVNMCVDADVFIFSALHTYTVKKRNHNTSNYTNNNTRREKTLNIPFFFLTSVFILNKAIGNSEHK